MVSQEQTAISVVAVTVISSYVLWSLLHAGTFLPYINPGTPNVANIVIFVTLLSLIGTGILVLCTIIIYRILTVLKRIGKTLSSVEVGILSLAIFLSTELCLLLHVFRVLDWVVTLLSYAVFWSIVIYGKYKERNRFKKYITASSGTGEGKSAVEIPSK